LEDCPGRDQDLVSSGEFLPTRLADLYLEVCPGRDQNLAAGEEFLITSLAEIYLEDNPGRDQSLAAACRISDYLAGKPLTVKQHWQRP
jgi:hypothetical protein